MSLASLVLPLEKRLYRCFLWLQAAAAHILCIQIRPRWRRLFGNTGPPMRGDAEVSAAWLTGVLRDAGVLSANAAVRSALVEDLEGNRGLTSAMNRVRVTYDGKPGDSAPSTLVMKMTRIDSVASRLRVTAQGAYREATFYTSAFGKSAEGITAPRAYYAEGSAFTGELLLLLEDITQQKGGESTHSVVPVNFLFGNQVWGVPAPLPADAPTPAETLRTAFLAAADTHAMHWNDRALLESRRYAWLKSSGWYSGRQRALWCLALDWSREQWRLAMKAAESGQVGVIWSPVLIRIVTRSLEASSWSALQRHLSDPAVPFTFVHGDFHASNMFWVAGAGIRAFDWSEAGVWEPTADLGQMMISDVKPEVRRAHERELVAAYAQRLAERGVKDYPLERCWRDFRRSGVERWIWSMGPLASFGLPAAIVQYFHDQTLAFILDHGGDENSVFPINTLGTIF